MKKLLTGMIVLSLILLDSDEMVQYTLYKEQTIAEIPADFENNSWENQPQPNDPDPNRYFSAVVLENADGKSILVEPDEGTAARQSSDKISVGLSNAAISYGDEINVEPKRLVAGTKVEIYFYGGMAESYPAQIDQCYQVYVLEWK
jgi:hypothetical protein